MKPGKSMLERAEHPLRGEMDSSLRERFLDHGARGRKVPPSMLVDLGDLVPRLWIESARRARRGLAQGAGLFPAGQLLLTTGESKQDTLPHGTLEPAVERFPVARDAALQIDRLPETTESDQLLRMTPTFGRAGDGGRHPTREHGEREDVVAIVLEHSGQRARALPAQIFEIGVGNHEPRQIVLPCEAKHVMLQRAEATVAEPRAPETARRPQKVEVKSVVGPATAGEDEACLEQGEIEARPVVGHDPVEV